jgi:hypothetical protein
MDRTDFANEWFMGFLVVARGGTGPGQHFVFYRAL